MKKILIVGYYGFRNTGDDAMLLGLLDTITTNGNKITVLCGPDLVKYNHDVRFKKWSLVRLLWETIRTSTVIIGGGTMLRDWGKGRMSQSLRVLGYTVLVKALGKKLNLFNIGHDSTRQPFQLLHKWVLSLADFHSVRDNGFDSSSLINGIPERDMKSSTLAVMLTPKWSIYHDEPEVDNTVLNSTVMAVSSWLSKDASRRVKFISLNGHPVHSDDNTSRRGAVMIGDRAGFVPWNPDVHETLKELAGCCGAIGMRYHSCVLSFLVGIPLLYITNKPYCDRFYKAIGWDSIPCNPVSYTISKTVHQMESQLDCLPLFRYRISMENAVIKARKGINI
jgi:polysaccharide pyruvyl transferase WcaK-like protein